ncbi:methyltransferase domain-containing protein [Streptomyces sp. bgisy027]|uniref:methyltransferase domain-containing protein n=1 Tax=Streptomyces sp. bgisy027 TaxID=3413770 RepID=UPI003D74D7E1
MDYSPANTALAQGASAARGLTEQVAFTTGDTEHFPCRDGAFDAVVGECALCASPARRRPPLSSPES